MIRREPIEITEAETFTVSFDVPDDGRCLVGSACGPRCPNPRAPDDLMCCEDHKLEFGASPRENGHLTREERAP